MPMSVPLPAPGDTSWTDWATDIDQAVRSLDGLSTAHGVTLSPGDSIQSAIDGGAKLIFLNPGTYNVSASGGIAIDSADRGVRIVGAGQQTRIVATAAMAGGLVNITGPTDAVQMEALVLDADGKAAYGLDVNSVGTTGNYQGEPDAVHRFRNLWVFDAITTGVYCRGQETRASSWDHIRVRRAGTYGFHMTNADSWVTNSEATTTSNTGAGFYVNAANCFFQGLKAWYCRGYGFHIQGTRNTFTNCHSQDTRLHGWFVDWDRNTYSSCIADSAAYFDVGGTVNGADGWYVSGDLPQTSIQACMGFDRRQGSGGVSYQRYGISAPAAMFAPDADGQVRIGGFVGYQNATGLVNKR